MLGFGERLMGFAKKREERVFCFNPSYDALPPC
jgi:hypothetical protein